VPLSRRASDDWCGSRHPCLRTPSLRSALTLSSRSVAQGVYPEGIDVLSKTDFYAVGIRRSAFLVVAPQVAQHELYRAYLLERYAAETLRHWDREVRALAAQALRAIAELDLEQIGPKLGQRMVRLCFSHRPTWPSSGEAPVAHPLPPPPSPRCAILSTAQGRRADT
jgi:hypothetical protein